MFKCIVAVGVLFSAGWSGALADELLTDGEFDSVLEYWSVDPALESWIPYDHVSGAISLDPPVMDYRGVIVSQPLNVEGVANKTVQVSLDVAGPDWGGLLPGSVAAVELEYMTLAGDRETVTVLSPDNALVPDGSFATFSDSYLFPADADRLVGFQILLTSGDYGVLVDSASLTSSEGLVAGPIPVLQSISPPSVAYGETVTVNGSNFGSEADTVYVDGKTNGVTVQTWTETAVTVLVDSVSNGGMLSVEVDGTMTLRRRELSVSSPHFFVEAQSKSPVVIAGQQIEVDVFAIFENGFTPTNGVTMSVPGYPTATFSRNPMMTEGGSVLYFDTTGMSTGIHTVVISAVETSLPPREVSFQVDVREVASCTLDVDGTTFTSQDPVTASLQIMDTLGNDITDDLPKPVWSSSAPAQINVFQEPSLWGSLYVLPHATGSAVLQAVLPDGTATNFSVSSSIPASPSILSHHFMDPIMSNDPNSTNMLVCLASDPMTYYSYSVSDLGLETHDSWWNGDNSQHTYEFTISENTKPGKYLFQSSATTTNGVAGDGTLLTVVNNPSTGLINGHVAVFGADSMHGVNGTMEFYDASGGSLLFSRMISEFTFDYTLPSIPPGSYKLRLLYNDVDEQWYANANSNTASTVVISAGAVANNIDFTYFDSGDPLPDPEIAVPPSFDSATGTFGFGVQTDSGENYQVLKSSTLNEGSWYLLESIWGDGSVANISDTNTQSSAAFYRVIRAQTIGERY
ncbi:MAG: IPT/TIG domain-containing protein [Verrucomicrobia bacterium]|nr:IPT/TIG domain-containing protein [Verrucomicrobiota bacterium]